MTIASNIDDAIHHRLINRPTSHHLVATIASFGLLGVVNSTLNRLYEASNHPVSYAEGQTSFDAEAIKGWYGAMSDAGTLDVYVGTQIFDYVFMAALALFGLTLASLIRRMNKPWRQGALLAQFGGLAVAIGACFDAVENLISFAMLADPTGFPDALAFPYSAAAVIKFAAIAIGVVSILGATIVGLVRRIPIVGGKTVIA